MEGMGAHHYWGYTPAADLCAFVSKDRTESICALDLGACDAWTVLTTLSRMQRKPGTTLELDVFTEGPLETVARHLLIMQIAMDWEVPIRKRANVILEVFGNALVQKRTSEYIAEAGKKLVHFFASGEGPLCGLVSLDALKYRDCDNLEKIFKFWSSKVPFDVVKMRDERLRKHMGGRYDARKNIYDWDYTYGLKPVASIVHIKQYRHWRETGVAFEFGNQVYDVPNRSMASRADGREGGKSCTKLGFWTDIVVSPFVSLGLDCEKPNQVTQDLFKVVNKGTGTEQHRRNAVHISTYNVLAVLHEIETGKRYEIKTDDDVYSGLGMETAGSDNPDAAEHYEALARERARCIVNLKSRVRIRFLVGAFADVFKRKRWHNRYDLVHVSTLSVHHLASETFPAL